MLPKQRGRRKTASPEQPTWENNLTIDPFKVWVTTATEDVHCDRCGGIIKQGEYEKVIQDKPQFHPRLRFIHSDKDGMEICPTQKSRESEQPYVSRRVGITQ